MAINFRIPFCYILCSVALFGADSFARRVASLVSDSPVSLTNSLSIDSGSTFLKDRNAFDFFTSDDETDTSVTLSEVKFLVTDIQTDNPQIFFINSNAFEYHWKFYNEALGWNLSLLDFNTRTYTDFNRKLIAGGIVAHDRYSGEDYPDGIYTIEFWPGDPLHYDEVQMTFDLVTSAMLFAEGRLVYHPAGETQVAICLQEYSLFEAGNVPVMHTSELFRGVDYSALNTGVACGILREGNSGGVLSTTDIPVFESIPNDISHVAGIITTIPQTPLSHINLKAKQNGTPNVYIPGFLESPEFEFLRGKYVRLTALPTGYTIEEISQAETLLWLESVRPEGVTTLERDLSRSRILNLEEIRLFDSDSYGAKASSLGELTWCLPSSIVPEGYAVPFYYYHKFMEYNNLYLVIDSLRNSDAFLNSFDARAEMLSEFRDRIRNSKVPPWMMDSLSTLSSQFESGISLRCRSSTNNEDLPGFNGAGLYNSYTHHEREGHISKTLKQVWAGMWTYRAYEEREFYRIDHLSAAMGVLIHPSYRGELANGVAVTRNIFNPFITGCYVNVQLGEDMVTNPESESVPEEFVVSEQNLIGESEREIQYIAISNRVSENERILSDEHIDQLVEYLETIHNHYRFLYGAVRDDMHFAMEIEFKITADGELVVKQARPWVSGI